MNGDRKQYSTFLKKKKKIQGKDLDQVNNLCSIFQGRPII